LGTIVYEVGEGIIDTTTMEVPRRVSRRDL
jgi:hypothetical protein